MKIYDIPEFREQKGLVTFSSDMLVKDAAIHMASHEAGAVPVVDNGKLVGIFSEQDMVKRVVAAGKNPHTTRVAEVMTSHPQTASPDDWVTTAIDYMVKGRYHHLPILDAKGELVGFLTERDFLAMSIGDLLKQTARISFITLAKAPEVWIIIGGFILYTLLILYIR